MLAVAVASAAPRSEAAARRGRSAPARAELAPEQRALGALRIRSSPDRARLAKLVARCDVATLLARAEVEGLDGLLYVNLQRAGALDLLAGEPRRWLRARYHRIATQNLRRQRDLAEILKLAAHRGLRPVVLKGMVLLDSLYVDLGTRPMTDVDLWVEAAEFDALTEGLRSLGYAPLAFYPDTYRRATTSIDLHTHLLGAERIRARGSILARGQSALLAHRLPLSVGGQGGARLGRIEEVIYLTLHLLKHNAERLVWLLELDALVGDWGPNEWSSLHALARETGQERSLAQAAFLAELLLPGRAGTGLRDLIPRTPLPRLERRALARRGRTGSLPIWGPLLFFSPQRRFSSRVSAAFETLFPRPRILRQIFEDAETSLCRLYVRRIGQLIERAVR